MAEAEPMTLELHYPANWAFEGEVEVLHLEGKGETSYGRQRLGLKSCHTQPHRRPPHATSNSRLPHPGL